MTHVAATNFDWPSLASVVAATFSAIAAIAAGCVTYLAYRTQARSADFSDCLQVVEFLRVAQKRVYDANLQCNKDLYRFESRELLNLLEALAFLCNQNKIAPSTSVFTKKFLSESLVWVKKDNGMKSLMHEAMTDDETFHELIFFNPGLMRAETSPKDMQPTTCQEDNPENKTLKKRIFGSS